MPVIIQPSPGGGSVTITDSAGVPAGGADGQYLRKASAANYDTEWSDSTTTWGGIDGTLTAQTDLQAALDAKAAASHSHAISDVTGLQTALDGKQASGSYAAASHNHAISDVTGLQTALDAKLDDSQLDTDTTLAANSDTKIATQKAVKAYVDANAGSGSITASGYTQSTERLLGRATSGTGAIEELSVGGGLSISGGQLSVSSAGGILSGTSFPVSPATGDVFRRTDRNIVYFYDGTRWLSDQIFTGCISAQETLLTRTASTVGEDARLPNSWADLYDIWLETAVFLGFVGGSGSWTIGLHSKTGSSAKVSIANSGAFTTANTSVAVRVAVNAVQASTIDEFNIAYTENSGTAAFYGSCTLVYRLVG